jgi:hypothetical protein
MKRWYGKEQWMDSVIEQHGKQHWTIKCSTGLWEIKNSLKGGKGCFSKNEGTFAKGRLIGVYPGRIMNDKQFTGMMSTLTIPLQEKVYEYLVQSQIHPGCYLSPVTEHGKLDKAWEHCHTLYCNEPNVGEQCNCIPVWNKVTERLEIWSCKDIQSGQELLVSYGQSYQHRNYQSSASDAPHWFIVADGGKPTLFQ